MNIDITAVEYHRNGVGGEGWWGVSFTWLDDEMSNGPVNRRMHATMPDVMISGGVPQKYSPDSGAVSCFVIDLDQPREHWRGDKFWDTLSRLLPPILAEKDDLTKLISGATWTGVKWEHKQPA